MIPRLSYYVEQKNEVEYNKITKKALSLILFLTIPAMAGLFILSERIIILFSGINFVDAILTMRIMTPIILIIALSNFTGMQILYPLKKEKAVLVSVAIGALSNFCLNMLLIPKFFQNGAAIATVISELLVLIVQFIFIKKYIRTQFLSKNIINYLVATIFMALCVFFINNVITKNILAILLSFIFGVIVYVLVLFVLKEEIILEEYWKRVRK